MVPSARPVWAPEAFVNAVWVATAETPKWIAVQTDALLTRLRAAVNIVRWETWRGELWAGSPEALASIVRTSVVRESISEGVQGRSCARSNSSTLRPSG
jgi:hypothetical protein